MATTDQSPFNALVAQAIAAYTYISLEETIILDISAKYCPEGISQDASIKENLSAIFDTIANLNRMTLEDPTLCAGEQGLSFREALVSTARDLAKLCRGRPMCFVELGPEPYKSHAILTQLLAAGVQLRQYIGVDINPESEEAMRKTLVPVIGSDRFTYLIADFYNARWPTIPTL